MTQNKPIILWLLSGCLLIFIMVIVGGITRLTNSGLSMVDWHLIMGVIPPLNHQEWQETFNLYKQYPEYQIRNQNFTLNEFKSIFFWEYIHRMIGRILGLVFIIPFIYFLIKQKLTGKLIIQTSLLFLMGGAQGFIGWWMVKSGLTDNPDVSHYRLAIHLIMAFLTFGYAFWIMLSLLSPKKKKGNKTFYQLSLMLLFIVCVQIIYGAFVAGLDGGIGYNTWPKMNEEWIPDGIYSMQGLWHITEGRYGVQFIHRALPLLISIIVFIIWGKGRNSMLNVKDKLALDGLFYIVILQIILGIFTLILQVPIYLAIAHQIVAFFLFTACIYVIFIFKDHKKSACL